MGVYNRLMKMPEHCKYCEWVRVDWDNIHFDGNGTVYCAPLFEPIPNDGRHKDCPLVEVKTPHGALIDRDTLMEGLKPRWDCMDDHDFADKGVWQALEETPILVEAEVE